MPGRREQSEPRRGRDPAIHDDYRRGPGFTMDHRVSQQRPFATLTGRCGPVMTVLVRSL